MVSTLQALRGNWEVLLSTMDVFLNEPVIEWVEGVGQRQNNDQGEFLHTAEVSVHNSGYLAS